MKILNLYASIGGNRKLWGDEHDITAVEIDPKVAALYSKYFPKDEMIIGDAHKYLLEHYQEFDFIWGSPPCPSHSDIRRCGVHKGQYKAIYPEMGLYQEIILLKNFFNGKFLIENVKPYYEALIKPDYVADRHYFWCNFFVTSFTKDSDRIHTDIIGSSIIYGFNIKDEDIPNKRKTLRNLVDPELGLHLLNCAESNIGEQKELFVN